jgi:hypothetical protein
LVSCCGSFPARPCQENCLSGTSSGNQEPR